MVPKVDTFAKDISEEIKHKEASLADIATASNDIGNSPEEASPMENRSSKIFFVAIGFLALGILALIGFIYYYFTTLAAQVEQAPSTETQATSTKVSNLSTLSFTLNENIGRHVSRVEKKENGYVLTLSSYAPVFAYVTRRESDYISQLIDTVGGEKVSAPKSSTPTPAASVATSSTSTSSPQSSVATGTQATTTEVAAPEDTSTWSNVTLSNVNIRIFTDGERTLAYSFVSTEKFIIASTAEDVLAIKNAILR